MWRELSLKMIFETELCGSVPRDPAIIDRWIATRTASDAHHKKLLANAEEKAGTVQTLEEVRQERHDTIDPPDETSKEDQSWVGFSRDDKGLFVRAGNLRAHLKDCAGVVGRVARKGEVDDMPQVLNFRAKVVDALYVKETRLHLLNGDGQVAQKPTGSREATLSVITAQGPRTCLKRVDYLDPAIIEATILLYPGEITRDWIKVLLDYGRVHGFGQDRSLQYGRYTYELGE